MVSKQMISEVVEQPSIASEQQSTVVEHKQHGAANSCKEESWKCKISDPTQSLI